MFNINLQVILCPLSGMLTIGGAAGHIVMASLKNGSSTAEVKVRKKQFSIEKQVYSIFLFRSYN